MFFHNTAKSLFLIITFCFAFYLGAEQIETINISGLKRTRDDTLLSIIDVKPGDGVTPGLTEAIEQKMRKAGIFQEEITVELVPGREGQILNITAYDQWTLIGIPFFAVSSGNMMGGAFLMDSNLRGKGNLFVSSVMLGQNGDAQAFLLFRDPTFRDSDISLNGRIAGGRTTDTYTSLDEKETWEDFSSPFFNLGTTAGYDLNDRLSLRLGADGIYRQLEKGDLLPPGGEDSMVELTLNAGISYDGTTVFPLFYKGISSSISSDMNWVPGDVPTWALTAEARSGWLIGNFLHLQLSGKGGVTDNPYYSLFQLGGSTGSMTLPTRQIASDRYLNGEFKSEIRVVKFSLGYLTAPLFYEGGYFQDYQEEDQFYQGVGGGFRFYLDRIALPAMGLDYRYCLTTETGGVSFFMGMSY